MLCSQSRQELETELVDRGCSGASSRGLWLAGRQCRSLLSRECGSSASRYRRILATDYRASLRYGGISRHHRGLEPRTALSPSDPPALSESTLRTCQCGRRCHHRRKAAWSCWSPSKSPRQGGTRLWTTRRPARHCPRYSYPCQEMAPRLRIPDRHQPQRLACPKREGRLPSGAVQTLLSCSRPYCHSRRVGSSWPHLPPASSPSSGVGRWAHPAPRSIRRDHCAWLAHTAG